MLETPSFEERTRRRSASTTRRERERSRPAARGARRAGPHRVGSRRRELDLAYHASAAAGSVADADEQRRAREAGAAGVVVELRPRRLAAGLEREVVVPDVDVLVPSGEDDLRLAVVVDVGHGGGAADFAPELDREAPQHGGGGAGDGGEPTLLPAAKEVGGDVGGDVGHDPARLR